MHRSRNHSRNGGLQGVTLFPEATRIARPGGSPILVESVLSWHRIKCPGIPRIGETAPTMSAPTVPTGFLVVLLTTIGAWADRQADIRLFMKGDFVFRKHCVDCHGKSGRGDGALAKDVAIKPRNFRTGIFKFRSTPMGFLPTDADLTRTIRTGVAGSMMPPFEDLTATEVTAVIAYLKSLSRRWKDPKLVASPRPTPKVPAWLDDPAKTRAPGAKGRKTFTAHCASCHGDAGQGDGSASKGLRDVWGDPITPARLGVSHPRSGPAPGDLFRTVAMGLDGTPMLGHLETLGPDRIWELVAFIQSLPDPNPDPER